MPHFLRDLRHAQHLFAVEICKEKKLRERNVARREFLGEMQQKTALHFQNNEGKPLGFRASLIRRSSCKRGHRSRVQADKTRNVRVPCQTCLLGEPEHDAQSSRSSAASLTRLRMNFLTQSQIRT